MQLVLSTSHVRLASDLDLATPAIAGGTPSTVTVPATEPLTAYMAHLVKRANNQSDPTKDNMLKIIGDGLKAALDLQLVGLRQPSPSKISRCAAHILTVAEQTANNTYTNPDGTRSDRTGALQVVFCDLGVPDGASEISVYDRLRRALIDAGMEPGGIEFIHTARTDASKANLFQRCRDGRTQVLIGSTERMGTGTNIQNRLAALHHLDAPWRPADVEQREGRILRPGNQNAEVQIFRYVTEGSLDAFKWQALQRKAGFIEQLWAARSGDMADVDEMGAVELSFAEVKAAAIGSPELIELANLEKQLMELKALAASHTNSQRRLQSDTMWHANRIDRLGRQIDTLNKLAANSAANPHQRLAIDDATLYRLTRNTSNHRTTVVGNTHGLTLSVHVDVEANLVEYRFADRRALDQHYRYQVDYRKLREEGLVARVEAAPSRINTTVESLKKDRIRTSELLTATEQQHGQEFPRAGELAALEQRVTELRVIVESNQHQPEAVEVMSL